MAEKRDFAEEIFNIQSNKVISKLVNPFTDDKRKLCIRERTVNFKVTCYQKFPLDCFQQN